MGLGTPKFPAASTLGRTAGPEGRRLAQGVTGSEHGGASSHVGEGEEDVGTVGAPDPDLPSTR